MKQSKSVFAKLLIRIAIVFLVLVGILLVILLTQKPESFEIANVDLNQVKDGTYVGSADNGLVKAKVSVQVSKGKILDVTILEHDNLLGKPAEKIIDHIVEEQSLDVDAISSATYSSDTIRKAVENALHQGEE